MDPFVYQYGVGAVVFAIGLFYAARQGYVGLSGRALFNLLVMLGGLLAFMVVQGYLQYAPMTEAPAGPPAAPLPARAGPKGTALDYGVMIVYMVMILAVGTWFGRRGKTTKDFFFGGQRFSWWLISFSLVATLVGSYSFVKYGRAAYTYGLSSSQTYMNDWPLMPLLIFGWLPILYFSRVVSVPEYFGRRFDSRVRFWATVSVLIYLVGYVGVNLFTMGKVLNYLVGWEVLHAAIVVATISAIYVTFGGQTSVIMTDLFQGIMLLGAGLLLLFLGIHHLGGFGEFWEHLPRTHRMAFSEFNADPAFPAVGIVWQDAMANSTFFLFLNQGILMRYMATKSTDEARKAALAMPLLLMPIAACVVASGGWVGRALVHAGVLPEMDAGEAFYVTAEFLCRPGVFGLILAALTAALMSTVDTLITAVSAVVVNDVYRPYVNPEADDRKLLRVARITAVSVTITGIALVPVFNTFKSIYTAHGAFTAAVTPPLVVTLIFSVFWRRFTATAALCTIVGGGAAILFSLFVPSVIEPIAHGVKAVPVGEDEVLGGMKQFKFMRGLFGLLASGMIGVVVTLFTRPEPEQKQRGLVWGTVADAIKSYKGSPGFEGAPSRTDAKVGRLEQEPPARGEAGLAGAVLSRALADELKANVGDLVYVSDTRWWLGGLRSAHVVVDRIDDGIVEPRILLGPDTHEMVVSPARAEKMVRAERLY